MQNSVLGVASNTSGALSANYTIVSSTAAWGFAAVSEDRGGRGESEGRGTGKIQN